MRKARQLVEGMRAELRLAESWGSEYEEEEEQYEEEEGEAEEEEALVSPSRPEPSAVSPRPLGQSSPGVRLPTFDRSHRHLSALPDEVLLRPWIEKLLLGCNPKLSSVSGSSLASHCPLLTLLDLSHASVVSLDLSSCSLLSCVRLNGCVALSQLSLPSSLRDLELDFV